MAQNLAFLASRTSLLKKSYVKVIFTLLEEGWRDLWKSPQQSNAYLHEKSFGEAFS